FLDKVAGTAAHGFDGDFNAAPGGHHHDGKSGIGGMDAVQKVEAFLAGGGVASVVQVHQQDVEFASLERSHDRGGGSDGFNLKPLAFQKKPKRFQNIGLIVRDQNPRANSNGFHRSPPTSNNEL